MYELEREIEKQYENIDDNESWLSHVKKSISEMFNGVISHILSYIGYWLLIPMAIYIGITLLCRRIMRAVP